MIAMTEREKEKLDELVPFHLRDGLQLYIEKGVPPGDFLKAVLENDLMEAMGRADENSRAGLYGICQFLYCYAPRMCRGSEPAVNAWLKIGGMRGLKADEHAS